MTCFRMDNGESVRKYCKRKGLGYSCIVYRIELGWTVNDAIKEAFKIKKRANRKSKHFINGVPLVDWCKEKGVGYSTLFNRARKLGMTPVEYIKKVKIEDILKSQSVKYFIDGIKLSDWCEKMKINYATVLIKAKNIGLSPVECAKKIKEKEIYIGQKGLKFV
ncbi:MAG: hypothetical protein J6S85_05825 [Methanobrevibacter sp.]|nr:hypothetical protein [Methanobrevibacter sp.]